MKENKTSTIIKMVLRRQHHHRQPNGMLLLAVLFALLCFFALGNGFSIRDDVCTDSIRSTCNCFSGPELDLECPRENPSIKLVVEMNRVDIDCYFNNDRQIYTYLPDLKLSNMSTRAIDQVRFKYCPLPEGSTIKGVIADKLGIDRVQTLTFSSKSDMQMRREQLIGLSSMRNLRFNGPITDLSEDAFNGVSNITTLELRSTNVHLPLNIFKNLSELEFLELGSNGLNHLASGIFSNQRKLRRLNLWGNNLQNLTKDSFVGATSVTELDLSSNNIVTLQSNIFEYFEDLENINLSSNNFTELPMGLFGRNKKLFRIRLLNNRIDLKTLPSGLLADLPQLQDVMIRCNVQFLPEDLFNGSSKIQNITLASNKLSTLPAELFSTQIELLNVDLGYNQLMQLPEYFFNSTKKIQKITLSHNNLREIPAKLFFGLTKLTELYLDNNNLHTIHRDAFKHTNLHIINLENNQLDFVKHMAKPMQMDSTKYPDYEQPFKNLRELTWLNLRNNSIRQFLQEWNTFNPELEVLDLSYNEIQSITLEQILSIWNHPITINLTHNQITAIYASKLEYLTSLKDQVERAQQIVDSQPNILWKWELNDNPINCDCKIMYAVKFLRENPSIEKFVKLTRDELKCATPENLQNQYVQMIKLDELLCPLDSPSTSKKYCPSMCECWVRTSDETGIFNCSNAGLTTVPKLPNLKSEMGRIQLNKFELNIENNRIEELPKYNELGYEMVTKINARNNSLLHVSNENLPLILTTLDVSRNKLQTLDGKVLMRLNHTGALQSLTLAGNPWACKCNTDFMKYLRLHPEKVDFKNIICSNGNYVHDESDVCPVQKRIVILIGLIIGLLGLLIGFVLALYYKYQQEVKVWLFAHNLCMWFVTEEELDKDKKYDAFISFSHKDEDFVTEQLVPELENGPHPFKICLHFRDWVIGEFIPNQISKSVEDSRRTIVVLTPNFIDSIWGRMEFRAAHKNALAEGRTRLIVIIYGDIGDIEKLDPELKCYLKTNTYVKWGDPWFFDKLRYAMPHPTNYKSKGLIKSTMKSSIDDKLELIKPQAVTPPLTTPPAEQAGQNPLIGKLNGENAKYHSGLNGLNGHVNGAFIINTNAKQSDV